MTGRAVAVAVGLALVAVAAGTGGCGKKKEKPSTARVPDDAAPSDAAPAKPERIALIKVLVRWPEPTPSPEIPEQEIIDRIRAGLERAGAIAVKGRIPPTHRARDAILQLGVDYRVNRDDDDKGAIVCVVEARFVLSIDPEAPAPYENVVMQRDLPTRPLAGKRPFAQLDDAIHDHVMRTLDAVAAGLAAKEEVRSGDPEVVREALRSPDHDIALWTLELAREHRWRWAYDDVVPLLRAEDRDLREAAIGALMALGDPRAVKPIAEAVDTQDTGLLRIAIDAAVELGGDEAVSWLEFLRDGHGDPTITQQATRGLLRLRAAGHEVDPSPQTDP